MSNEDLRDWLIGHDSLSKPINVREELKRLRNDPLSALIVELGENRFKFYTDEFVRYQESYDLYYLALERYLKEMSIAIRYRRGPYWVRKSGGKYTNRQRNLAQQYNAAARYLQLDLYTCIMYARIVLDRAVALSRYFLTGQRLPSFTSFNEHKKFFAKLNEPFNEHEEYAQYIRSNTGWFNTPLKLVRDKFLVHSGPRHRRVLGYPDKGYELALLLVPPSQPSQSPRTVDQQVITFSIPQMAREIEGFLNWFSAYGVAALRRQQGPGDFSPTVPPS